MSEQPFDLDQPLTDADGQLDEDALVEHAAELAGRYLEAPEGAQVDDDDLDAVEGTIFELVERGVREHGVRPTQLTAPVLERIVFEELPLGWRHPAEAGPILETLASFMRFVGRALPAPGAAECVALLEAEGAEERLATAFRAVNATCPDPELAGFLQEDRADEGPRSSRSREEQRREKDKKKAAKKAKRRNRR